MAWLMDDSSLTSLSALSEFIVPPPLTALVRSRLSPTSRAAVPPSGACGASSPPSALA